MSSPSSTSTTTTPTPSPSSSPPLPPIIQPSPPTAPPRLHPARHPWPPDFARLPPTAQFRLERRYRRRAKLAYTRPGWVRGVKLVQGGVVLGVLAYGVLGMDWGDVRQPFGGIRAWVREKLGTPPPSLGRIGGADSGAGRDGSRGEREG